MTDLFDRLGMKQVGTMVKDSQLRRVVNTLGEVIRENVNGDVVEFGCNMGNTSVFLQKALIELKADKAGRRLWCYDSFQGLPPAEAKDQGWWVGANMAVSRKGLEGSFVREGLPLPEVKEGWFKNLTRDDVPKAVCLAFLDCDRYSSTVQAIRLVWPSLSPGGMLVIHDSLTPGVVAAINENLIGSPCMVAWNDTAVYGMIGIRRG